MKKIINAVWGILGILVGNYFDNIIRFLNLTVAIFDFKIVLWHILLIVIITLVFCYLSVKLISVCIKHYANQLDKNFIKITSSDNDYNSWCSSVMNKLYGDKYMLKTSSETLAPCFTTKIPECNVDNFALEKIDYSVYKEIYNDETLNIKPLKSQRQIYKYIFPSLKHLFNWNNIKCYWIYIKYKVTRAKHVKQNNYGFLLKNINLKDGVCTSASCELGAFTQNFYTSLILEFELYLAYINPRKRDIIKKAECSSKILNLLPLRKKIHESNKNILQDILHTGKGRYSLLSVQLMIIYYDSDVKEYCTILRKRSGDLSTKAGYYQFIPAGGFEPYEGEALCRYEHNINASYTIKYAIYRELLEELFGKYDYEECSDNRPNISVNNIIDNEEPIKILKKYCNTSSDNEMKILGIVTDLLTLRSMFTCVIRIDNPDFKNDFISKLKYNEEFVRNKTQYDDSNLNIGLIKLSNIDTIFNNNQVTPDSIAMYELVKETELYKQITE